MNGMNFLYVSLDSWIIQDGNYADFTVGDESEFALEFYPQSLSNSQNRTKSAKCLSLNRYSLCGEIIFKTPEVWIIDAGFLAYQEDVPQEFMELDAWVEGTVDIGIDPFSYKETFYKLPGMPNLNYRFRIEQILRDTTPWITVRAGGRTMNMRDETKKSEIAIEKTDAWNDDDGNAGYILKCSFIDTPD